MKIMSNYSSELTRPNISEMLSNVKNNKGKSYKGGLTLRDLNRMDKLSRLEDTKEGKK